jgi:hypothetical protein
MMLESPMDTFHHIVSDPPLPDRLNDLNEGTPSRRRSKSHYESALTNPLPRILYSPPTNFGMVTHNLYRSSFPQKENFPYLRKLGLKSVLYTLSLVKAKVDELEHWCKKNIPLNILHF